MSEKELEKEIQAKGLTAPRITPADLDANIADVEIVKHVTKAGKVLREDYPSITLFGGFNQT